MIPGLGRVLLFIGVRAAEAFFKDSSRPVTLSEAEKARHIKEHCTKADPNQYIYTCWLCNKNHKLNIAPNESDIECKYCKAPYNKDLTHIVNDLVKAKQYITLNVPRLSDESKYMLKAILVIMSMIIICSSATTIEGYVYGIIIAYGVITSTALISSGNTNLDYCNAVYNAKLSKYYEYRVFYSVNSDERHKFVNKVNDHNKLYNKYLKYLDSNESKLVESSLENLSNDIAFKMLSKYKIS